MSGLSLFAGAGDLVGVAGAVVAGGEGGVAQAVAEQPRLRPPPEHSLKRHQAKIVTYHDTLSIFVHHVSIIKAMRVELKLV